MKLDTRVLIVGAGPAGITAAIGLAKRKIPVVVIEGAVHAGAENWSGAVYFAENLARPEILGETLLEQTPIERRVEKRGLLLSDGAVAAGFAVRSEAAFRHCYTVLRPLFDHDLAEKARLLGARILNSTTALALLRDGDQVRGVLTDRGPIYAEVVFLAEGDASHLVAREGLERKPADADGQVRPEFLQGIKEVIELPSGVLEQRFGVTPGVGACFEVLLRNGMLDGKSIPLNAGAFLYTNRESVSLGLVAPLENLKAWTAPHNLLMEWFKGLPAIAPLLEGGRSRSFGAKIIRGGGYHEIPRLVLPGLAVGGAASGLGVDFPCPNYTGPATFMGFAFSEAVHQILESRGEFTEAALEEHYLSRVRQSHYFADVQHLKEWPHFIGSAREFFGRQVDLVAGTADFATRREQGGRALVARHWAETLPWRKLAGFQSEMKRAASALAIGRVDRRTPKLLGWWVWNLVRGFWPRATETGATVEPVLWHDGQIARRPVFPLLRYGFHCTKEGLAAALHHLYRNDPVPLATKLADARYELLSRLSLLDLVLIPILFLATHTFGILHRLGFGLWVKLSGPSLDRILATPWMRRSQWVRSLSDYRRAKERVDHDRKLATISYRGDEEGHIRFLAAYDQKGMPDHADSALFHVCPAKVYKKEVDQSLQASVAVLHENCVRCETCWRADDRHVDWGRARGHRLVYEAYSSAEAWLHESRAAAGLADSERSPEERSPALEPPRVDLPAAELASIQATFESLIRSTRAWRALFVQSSSVLSGADQELLRELARDIFGTAREFTRHLDRVPSEHARIHLRARAIAAWGALAEPRVERRRFFQIEADLRLLVEYHLADLESGLGLTVPPAIHAAAEDNSRRAAVQALLDPVLTREACLAWDADALAAESAFHLLKRLLVSLVDSGTQTLPGPGTPVRELVLAELARRAPGLAVVLARHLLAIDLMARPELKEPRAGARAEIQRELLSGRVWATVIDDEAIERKDARLHGETAALLGGVGLLLVVDSEGLDVLATKDAGVSVERMGGIGLRTGSPSLLRFEAAAGRARFEGAVAKANARARGAVDLITIAATMGEILAARALDHAQSRVQFPGLFRDLRGRDGIAKFGAVQEMLAGIGAGQAVLASLRNAAWPAQAAAALCIDLLGTSPRSISYLSGQVLGGTAYSEEDEVCRLYRDAAALTRIPLHVGQAWKEHGEDELRRVRAEGQWPLWPESESQRKLSELAPPSAREGLAATESELENLARALAGLGDADRRAITRDVGRLAAQATGLAFLAQRAKAAHDQADPRPELLSALEWFGARVSRRARRLRERLADLASLQELGRQFLEVGVSEGPSGAKGASYADYLHSANPWKSGDGLRVTSSAATLAYTPELLEADADLCAIDRETAELWKARFQTRDRGQRPYSREVEALHHVPLTDIRWLLERGDFRQVIPKAYLGQGKKKAAYYVVCSRMMRHGDPTQAIIVMGSTSIGTTPILIGLEQDLPQARKALSALRADPAAVDAIVRKLKAVRAQADTPAVVKLAEPMKALANDVKSTLGREKAFRRIFQGFLEAFQAAALAGMRQDLPAFRAKLDQGAREIEGYLGRVDAELAELPHREAAHAFYLRLISSGRISAFALTEPSAGSDTARIRTRAQLTSVPAVADPRGFYRFVPEGGTATRNLVTYDRVRIEDGRLWFLRPDGSPTPIELRDFDHEAASAGDAASAKYRWFEVDGERIDIHDFGRVEIANGQSVYRYFRVNGAKMWITNGSIAGVMVLYARTPAGPTGFMLDAHAEGLTIGRDEHKMGQRGSATNELALSDVRIGVDQIIGMEGRGQENALETLNVGRAGLAICSVGLMQELAQEVREGLAGRRPTADELVELGRMAVDLAGSEALAYQLVGRFDHPGTSSIRMESATAKATTSEALHRLLVRAERLLPSRYALDGHELEKRRRDARVLTIYEGTNEIQRFLLSKDLADVLELEPITFAPVSGESESLTEVRAALEAGRREFFKTMAEARADLGSKLWQHAPLQSIAFRLVEAGMRISVLSAAAHRLALAERLQASAARRNYLALATRLLASDLPRRLHESLAEYREGRSRLLAGADLVAQAAADRWLLAHAKEIHSPAHPASKAPSVGALRIAVFIDPKPALSPEPRISHHRLREPWSELSSGDRAAVAEALRWRAHGSVEVTVVGVGGIEAIEVLEETLALGADHAFLLNTGGRHLLAPEVAGALVDLVRTREGLLEAPFDLFLGPTSSQALLLPLSRRLGVDALLGVEGLSIERTGERALITARLSEPAMGTEVLSPAFVLLNGERTAAQSTFDVEGWRRGRTRSVSVIDYLPEGSVELLLEGGRTPVAESTTGVADPTLDLPEVAARFVDLTGLGGAAEGASAFGGEIALRSVGEWLSDYACVAIVMAKASGELSPAARAPLMAAAEMAAVTGGRALAVVLLPGAPADHAMRLAVAEVRQVSRALRTGVLAWPDLARASYLTTSRLLELLLLGDGGAHFYSADLRAPALLAAEGLVTKEPGRKLIDSADQLVVQDGELRLSGVRFDGKVRFRLAVPAAMADVICARELSLPGAHAGSAEDGEVVLLDEVPLPTQSDPLLRALAAAETKLGGFLADAEFIIDVGYGVGSRDGIEEVIEPLKRGLERLGIRNVTVGATRKVTLDLGILPASAQIGQTGTSVNPKVLLAIGVSGAPQHLEYIGKRAVIFAFNKDPDAPLVTLNRTRAAPIVYPIMGDLFREVPAFLTALESHLAQSKVA